ncbi:PSP1 domain-containing protein [Aequorivita marisscotiae]|uniref:Regulatory iron-sulfur-containing complex subunit RicT n=1 Tax=Aequorivita marisscotiae TaxID=3040348 RepID=A0ABY8KZP8_9FLAO|nr:regulatory iron-sulfur-containing complex subunit RicT [Aequorivita sp. Ant34-E75]WGF93685.1 regulatory iron-sulfur-containing complex subunit RicT [Aequorivita sp. Ant34-E75]
MGCTSCATGTTGQPKGCKNNGTCGTDGCNKLTVFDWLSNMQLPADMEPFNAAEVRFKNGRKEFFQNSENITLSIGDIVATEASPGHDIGIVTLTGELVRVQMRKKKIPLKVQALPKIYRKATQKDIDIWQGVRDKEADVQKRSRQIAIRLGLQMKISDVEFQGDASKVIFYYTAEERVDFRELIKEFARTFNTRIEMKQVGFRQEAARLGGIGSCGRELCCSTWLTDFRSVNTSAARYQQLSLNPQKLAGQCGKLKCCLNYELDTYLEALESFPSTDTKLQTEKGYATCQKIDIFKGVLWYAYEKEFMNWHELSAEKANEIIELNKKGKKPMALEEFIIEAPKIDKEPFSNTVGQDSLTRFDKPKQKSKKRRNKKRNKKSSVDATSGNAPKRKPRGNSSKPSGNRPQKNRNRKPKKDE